MGKPDGCFHGHGGTPIAGWFILEITFTMDYLNLDVPPFMDTPISVISNAAMRCAHDKSGKLQIPIAD